MTKRLILLLALLGVTVFAMGRIIPAQDETLVRIYRCGICKAFLLEKPDRAGLSVGCTVYHPPGSCCHHEGDEAVSVETVQNVYHVLALARKGLVVTWSAVNKPAEVKGKILSVVAEEQDGV